MRKLFMILLAASGSLAQAQTTTDHPFATGKGKKPDAFHKHVMSLLRTQQAAPAQKTTAMKQRVIAEAGKDPAMVLMDSSRIKYVGTNGSSYDFNFMSYNYGYSSFGFTPNYYPYDFGKIEVKHDSLWHWGDDGSGFDITATSTAQHTSAGLLSSLEQISYVGGSFDYGDQYINSVDAQGRFARLVYLEDAGSGFDSVGKLLRTYNAGNQPVADTIYDYTGSSWDLSGMLRYTYTTGGKLDSLYMLVPDGMGGWIPDAVYVHTHDNAGRLKTVTGYADVGSGSLTAVVADTFAYTGTNTFFTTLTEYGYNGAGLEPSIQISKHLNASNLPDTMWLSQYDFASGVWVPMIRREYAYNSNGNIEKQNIYVNNTGTSFDLMGRYDYYYELFDDGTSSVRNTVKNADITLYPNPATTELNMVWNEADGKPAVVEIINAAGQRIVSQSFSWREKNQKIGFANAAPGMYWVIVKNASGVTTFRQSVIKQ